MVGRAGLPHGKMSQLLLILPWPVSETLAFKNSFCVWRKTIAGQRRSRTPPRLFPHPLLLRPLCNHHLRDATACEAPSVWEREQGRLSLRPNTGALCRPRSSLGARKRGESVETNSLAGAKPLENSERGVRGNVTSRPAHLARIATPSPDRLFPTLEASQATRGFPDQKSSHPEMPEGAGAGLASSKKEERKKKIHRLVLYYILSRLGK